MNHIWKIVALLLAAFGTTTVLCLDISKCKVLDMAHPLSAQAPHYPGYAPPNFTITHKGPIGKDAPYASWGFMCSFEHMSTHMDAPAHFDEHGITIDEVGFENMVGEARVIDVTEKAKKDPNYGVTVQDILDHEQEHGVLLPNSILLMNSGWDAKFDDFQAFVGTTEIKDFNKFRFPSFGPEVGKWLVANRNIRAYGVDTLAFDVGGSTAFPNHYALLTKGIPGMENLKNIGKLPPKGSVIFLPPTKIKGGTGAWTRAFAVGWTGQDDPCRIGYSRGALRQTCSSLTTLTAGVLLATGMRRL